MQNLKDIPCLILGIGNILWADEGFGVRVVEAFNDKYAFTDPNNVIADGGTLGMYLYDRICRAEKLLIFDCCDFKGKPGELRVLRNDDVKLWTSTKISPLSLQTMRQKYTESPAAPIILPPVRRELFSLLS